MIRLQINQHLLVPYGCEKWRIEDIKVSGVSTTATYFESTAPLAYIDRTSNVPLTFGRSLDVMTVKDPEGDEPEEWAALKQALLGYCDARSAAEKRFLELYFDFIERAVAGSWEKSTEGIDRFDAYDILPLGEKLESRDRWLALLPLPQAHLYLENPLVRVYRDGRPPSEMVKVDFVFWTGKQLVAVEIDGQSHVGDEKHVRRDRQLKRAGVDVHHILNGELMPHGVKLIGRLLPREISRFWEFREDKPRHGPFFPF